ncbi:MAG TPA: hypothetical protein VMN36_03915 [Verrucomicrobiales bacterium]|nr:hypothetical protein [Verrucomicrobiales bacterium]
MASLRSPKRILFRIAFVIAVPVLLFGGFLLLDQIPMAAARPPKDLKTIEDFQTWKRGSIIGSGTFESSGVAYTVMLAPAGRYMASGPSAYLFDEHGQFVDWSADMGDFYTVKNRFDLTSGHVKNIRHEKP